MLFSADKARLGSLLLHDNANFGSVLLDTLALTAKLLVRLSTCVIYV